MRRRASTHRHCGAKHAAESTLFLKDEVVAAVGHAAWHAKIETVLRLPLASASGVAVLLLSLALEGKVTAADPPYTIREFPLAEAGASYGGAITEGSDGAVWFTLNRQYVGAIGRVTMEGVVTEFVLPGPSTYLEGICKGPDGAVWFTVTSPDRVGRISPAGSITEFPIPTVNHGLGGITAGTDGNLWFAMTNDNRIGRLTPSGQLATFDPGVGISLAAATSGGDGALWFTSPSVGLSYLVRATTQGMAQHFQLPQPFAGRPYYIARGEGSDIWYLCYYGTRIGRYRPGSGFWELVPPPEHQGLTDLTVSHDGEIWLTGNPDKIVRLKTSGVFDEFRIPTPSCYPTGITMGRTETSGSQRGWGAASEG